MNYVSETSHLNNSLAITLKRVKNMLQVKDTDLKKNI